MNATGRAYINGIHDLVSNYELHGLNEKAVNYYILQRSYFTNAGSAMPAYHSQLTAICLEKEAMIWHTDISINSINRLGRTYM